MITGQRYLSWGWGGQMPNERRLKASNAELRCIAEFQ